MKKTSFVVAILVSAALAACHHKKANTTTNGATNGSSMGSDMGSGSAMGSGGDMGGSAAPAGGGM